MGTWPARMGRELAVAVEEEGVVVKGEDGGNPRILQLPQDQKAQSVIALWLAMGILEISLRTLQDPVAPLPRRRKVM